MRPLILLLLACSPVFSEIKLDPTFHFNGAVGQTSADAFRDIGGHAHDPNNDFSVQGFEPGLNLRVDEWLAGFTNLNVFTTADHDVDWEVEEAFLKLKNLPGGFEVRGGRMLNRIGLQNNQHLHAWTLVNSNLSLSRFLGEEGLMTYGGELTWQHDFDRGFFAISTNFGNAVSHEDHDDHGDEDEDEDHDGEDHHADHDSSEDAYLEDDIVTTRILFGYNTTDFHQHRVGLNTAWGKNGFERQTFLASLDYVYTWRENGLEQGGRSLSVGAEYFIRDVEWRSEEDPERRGSSSQNSVMAFADYRFHPQWIAGLRYEYLDGARGGGEFHEGELEYAYNSPSRERLSLALTREFRHQDTLISTIRLQYSHDNLEEGNADSVWLQFGLDFGGPEVR